MKDWVKKKSLLETKFHVECENAKVLNNKITITTTTITKLLYWLMNNHSAGC